MQNTTSNGKKLVVKQNYQLQF